MDTMSEQTDIMSEQTDTMPQTTDTDIEETPIVTDKIIKPVVDSPSSPECLLTALEELLDAQESAVAIDIARQDEHRIKIIAEGSALVPTIVKHLIDDNYYLHPTHYHNCEELLKFIAREGDLDDVMVELLMVTDERPCDNAVISAMRAMQDALLRETNGEYRHLEWCVNSIQSFVSELPLTMDLRDRNDASEMRMLDDNGQIKRICSIYFYLDLFVNGLRVPRELIEPPTEERKVFRENGHSRRNALIAFVIQLFAEPLGYLDLSAPTEIDGKQPPPSNLNAYAQEIARLMANHYVQMMRNPLYLIGYGERRHRWPHILPNIEEAMKILPTTDIFVIEAKAPFVALAIMYYVLFAENRMPSNAPQIYQPSYLFEMGLYYANALISKPDESYRTKGIKLAQKLLENMADELLGDETLYLDIHRQFSTNLIHLLDTTRVRKNSKTGVVLFQTYINKFRSTEAKVYHVRHLFTSTNNKKIQGFLVTFYKNIVAEQLDLCDDRDDIDFPDCCRDDQLNQILQHRACTLPDGIETDLVENSDVLVAGLNFLRFLVIRDRRNLTKLWDDIKSFEIAFLSPLREALDHSRAQYKLEEQRIRQNSANMLRGGLMDAEFAAMAEQNRLAAMHIARNTFDLIESLMTRVMECVESRRKTETMDS